MTFRRRIALAAASAVAVALLAAASASYIAVNVRLQGDMDASLRAWSDAAVASVQGEQDSLVLTPGKNPGQGAPTPAPVREGAVTVLPAARPAFGGLPTYYQLITASAVIPLDAESPALPATPQDRQVATDQGADYFWDATVSGVPLRGYTRHIGPDTALQVARPTTSMQQTMGNLAWILGIVTCLGILLGGLLAWIASRRALVPVVALTRETEAIAEAGDLSQRVSLEGTDELGRLARTVNDTLARLERSAKAQQRLVADASHELRTPLASLRANVEILQMYDQLPPMERSELLQDVVTQSQELSALIADIIQVGEQPIAPESMTPVHLDECVTACIGRAERLAPHVQFVAHVEPTLIEGVPERCERLVGNLLDNAVKYGSLGAPRVDVRLENRTLTVRDYGPGFTAGEEEHVLERFYRGQAAEHLPGSGLGLAIAAGVAQMHGATITCTNAPDGGGGVVRVHFP